MSRVITKPFREAHADIFQCEPFYESEFRASIPLLSILGKQDQCAVHMLDGRILWISGYAVAAVGVAELFIYPSIYAKRHPKTLFQEVRFCVQHLKAQFRRVQCWGEDTELSKRWLSRLGFLYEGTLKNYTTDGSSLLIWGLT